MSRLLQVRNIAFFVGFAATLFVLGTFNFLSYARTRYAVMHTPDLDFATCGFPRPIYLYSMGGFLGIDWFLWDGIAINTLFALVVGVVVGLLCRKFAND